MEKLVIHSKTRDLKGRRVKEIRKEGRIPGIVYGPGIKNRLIEVGKNDFRDVFRKAGESTLIDLEIDGEKVGKVVINDYQVDPVSDEIIHVDLYQVRMDKKMIAKVPVEFVGESPAVKNEGGVLVKSHDKLEVRCLPQDLIHSIKVDISNLKNIDDVIRVKDIKISDKIEILSDPEEVIVNVAPPRSEKEIEELEEKVEENVEEVESVKEEKEKEEAGEESEEEGAEK